jgi:hypothetical protein
MDALEEVKKPAVIAILGGWFARSVGFAIESVPNGVDTPDRGSEAEEQAAYKKNQPGAEAVELREVPSEAAVDSEQDPAYEKQREAIGKPLRPTPSKRDPDRSDGGQRTSHHQYPFQLFDSGEEKAPRPEQDPGDCKS